MLLTIFFIAVTSIIHSLERQLLLSNYDKNITIMKNNISILYLWMFLILAGVGVSCSASKDASKTARKEIKKKAVREARKEARRYKRQDWYVAPGALPMDKQVERAWEKQYLQDENGYPLYLVATGNSVAETQAAAKLQSMELAKLELAGLVQTNIAALIENSIANNQLNAEDAASVTKTVAASKNVIAQEIGRVDVLFEIYRRHDMNTESTVRIGYRTDMAMETAKKAIRKQLEDETDILHEKLDRLLNF